MVARPAPGPGRARPSPRPAGAAAVAAAALARAPPGAGAPVLVVTATGREAEDLAAAAALLLPEHAGRRASPPGRRCRTSGSARAPTPSAAGWPCCAGWRTRTPRTTGHGPVSVVVAPVRSRAAAAGRRARRPRAGRSCSRATSADLDDVVAALADAAYTRVDLVEKRGEFAVRGGILDVFPPTEEHPLRVEFWGDEVEEIRYFTVADQRSLEIGRARPVGAALPRAAAHRRGARSAPPSWRPSTPSSPRCSTSSPRASRSRAWSRSRRCSSTSMDAAARPSCRPARTSLRLRPGAGRAPAPPTWCAPAQEFLAASWAAAAGGGQAPIDLGRRRPSATLRRGPRARRRRARACRGGRSRPFARGRGRPDERRRRVGAAAVERYRGDTARALGRRPGAGSATAGASCSSPRATGRRSAPVERARRAPTSRARLVPDARRRPGAGVVHVTHGQPRARLRRRRRCSSRCSPRPT